MNKNLMFGAIILILSSVIFITMNLLDSFESNLDKEAIEKADNSLNLKEKQKENMIVIEKTNETPSFTGTNKIEESQAESVTKNEDTSIETDRFREDTTDSKWGSSSGEPIENNNVSENPVVTNNLTILKDNEPVTEPVNENK